jgi:hypothetical protein
VTLAKVVCDVHVALFLVQLPSQCCSVSRVIESTVKTSCHFDSRLAQSLGEQSLIFERSIFFVNLLEIDPAVEEWRKKYHFAGAFLEGEDKSH